MAPPPQNEVLDELARRGCAGDEAAAAELLEVVRPRLLAYCRRRLCTYPMGAQRAEDALQEAMLAVWSGLPSWVDQGVPFGVWVARIVSHKVADQQRRADRTGKREWMFRTLPDAANEDASADLVLTRAEAEPVLAAVQRLSERQRRIVLLRAAGWEPGEVGEELGMSGGAVRVAHFRAVRQVREWLAETD